MPDIEINNQIEFVKEWIRRLRSGDYTKDRGLLRRIITDEPDGYCCIGVGCEIGVDMGILNRIKIEGRYYYYSSKYETESEGSAIGWPKEFVSWLAKALYVERPFDDFYSTTLICLNDEDNISFNQIADYIEEKILPELREL